MWESIAGQASRTLGKETSADEELREVTMQSLKRTINQFKEEIARYEVHQGVRR